VLGSYCSDLSRQAGESLYGSASQIKTWFLLEYTGQWRAKAIKDNDLSQPVQEWMASALDNISLARFLFIKQPPRKPENSINFYVAVTDEKEPRLYRFRLDAYEDLLALDVPAIVAGDPVYQERLDREPLFLICTNGERDLCCARRGISTYNQMSELVGDRVWQCTHVGGHRFATNCLYMPFGIYYGQVDEGDLASFVEDGRNRRLNLEHYRGRSHYDVAGQVGEYFLRRQTNISELAHYRLVGVETPTEDGWVVRFASPTDETHAIHIEKTHSAWEGIQSCGQVEKSRVPQYRMVDYEVLKPERGES
jgi:hypothetical protein